MVLLVPFLHLHRIVTHIKTPPLSTPVKHLRHLMGLLKEEINRANPLHRLTYLLREETVHQLKHLLRLTDLPKPVLNLAVLLRPLMVLLKEEINLTRPLRRLTDHPREVTVLLLKLLLRLMALHKEEINLTVPLHLPMAHPKEATASQHQARPKLHSTALPRLLPLLTGLLKEQTLPKNLFLLMAHRLHKTMVDRGRNPHRLMGLLTLKKVLPLDSKVVVDHLLLTALRRALL